MKEPGMALAEKASQEVAHCRHLLEGMAKNLVDRLFGPDGPAWGTPFATVENTALRLADSLRKKVLDLALSRQAATFLQNPPPSLCLCPTCGRDTLPKEPEPRVFFCRATTVFVARTAAPLRQMP